MITPELIQYIKQQLAKNINPEQIKNSLRQVGWLESDIAQGFLALDPNNQIPITQLHNPDLNTKIDNFIQSSPTLDN